MRKYFGIIFTLLVLLFFGLWLKAFLGVGFLDVKVPKDSVAVVKDSQDNEVFESSSSFEKKIKTGSYTVSISNKSLSSKKKVVIKSRKHISVNIDIPLTQNAKPIANIFARDIMPSEASLMFVDADRDDLTELDTVKGLVTLGDHPFIKAVWADKNYGVLQDEAGDIYVANGQTIEALDTGINRGIVSSYYVSPDRTIYTAYSDGSVYSGQQGKEFSLIYSSGKSANMSIVAGSKYLALIDSRRTGENLEIKSTVQVIDSSGRSFGQDEFDVGHDPTTSPSYKWSPNGEMIAIATGEGPAAVYDKSLHKLFDIPGSSPRNITWRSDSEILFSDSSNIWSYSRNNDFASVVYSFTADTTIYELALNKTDGHIFISSSYNDRNTLYEVSPDETKVDIESLAVLLPAEEDGCRIDYINFGSLFIYTGSTDSLKPTQDCTPVAKRFLTENYVNLPGVEFKHIPFEKISGD